MVKLSDRSEHIVNLKGKPISEGFEIWGFGFAGYVYSWLFHSLKEGPEGISKKKKFVVDQVIPLVAVTLAPTIQVIYIDSVTRRHPQQQFLAIIDNLFLNAELAHCLMRLKFAVLGTARKNAEDIASFLVEAKNAKQHLHWNRMLISGYVRE